MRPGDEGFVRTDIRFSHEYVTPMAAIFWRDNVGPEEKVVDPGSIFFFRDHLTFLDLAMTHERKAEGLLDVALELKKKQEEFAAQQGIQLYGELPRSGPQHGGARLRGDLSLQDAGAARSSRRQVIIGSDSHTPHSGAMGSLAFGVGTTAIFNSWLTARRPSHGAAAVLIRVKGAKPANVTAKDFMLQILRHPVCQERAGDRQDRRVRRRGGAGALDRRAGHDDQHGRRSRGLHRHHQARREGRGLPGAGARACRARDAAALLQGLESDPDAEYDEVIEIDAAEPCSRWSRCPVTPATALYISELGRMVKVDIAYAGSCTAGKKEDMDMYAAVLREAADAGEKVHPDVRFYIQFGSQDVKRYAEQRGYVEVFRAVGAEIIEPSCGACINAGPGVSYDRETVTVSAINRNFPGRSGPGQLYLASPYTTAASALAGYITGWESPAVVGGG